MDPRDPCQHFASLLREQADWCRRLDSPLYAALLDEAATDAAAGGPTSAVLRGHEADPPGSALALRLMGAVHRLVLEGRAPALARHYPSAGGDASRPGAWTVFRTVLDEHCVALRALLARPVQTNEVGRSAVLLGGFVAVARQTGLPLRCLEIGASAGLNLRWDHFRYEAQGTAWGDPASPVSLRGLFDGAPPPLDVPMRVGERAGCDTEPVDATTRDGALTLRAYLWPDQGERHTLLAGAIEIARRVPAAVERADAPAWLARQLHDVATGAATVVYHSITWQYLSTEGRRTTRACIEDAGRRATARAPVAWLRFEPAGREGPYRVRLTTWPGGADRLIAEAGPHGRRIRWLGDANPTRRQRGGVPEPDE